MLLIDLDFTGFWSDVLILTLKLNLTSFLKQKSKISRFLGFKNILIFINL